MLIAQQPACAAHLGKLAWLSVFDPQVKEALRFLLQGCLDLQQGSKVICPASLCSLSLLSQSDILWLVDRVGVSGGCLAREPACSAGALLPVKAW